MHDAKAPWRHGVVLVCNNQRADGAKKPSCGRAHGTAVKAWLKEAAREAGGPAAECRVLNSSCLDLCPTEGVAVALMPGNGMVVVDPMDDRQALLERVQDHMTKVSQAEGAGGGPGRRVSSVLGKLRGR